MNSKYIAYIVLAVIAIFGWNWFIIQRDIKMFEQYDKLMIEKRVDV